MIKLVLLTLLCLLFGCSKNGPTTNAKLEITNAFVFSGQPGGVMLYLVNKDQNLQRSVALESNQTVIPLINGNWEFNVLAWDGGTPLTGNLKCAQKSVLLDNITVEVNLSLSAEACDQDFFAPSNFRSAGVMKTLRLVNCQDTFGLTSGSNCDSANRGFAGSFRIKLLSHTEQSLTSLSNLNFASLSGLTTSCFTSATSPQSISNTTLKVPFGSTFFNPPVVIEAFEDGALQFWKKRILFSQWPSQQ